MNHINIDEKKKIIQIKQHDVVFFQNNFLKIEGLSDEEKEIVFEAADLRIAGEEMHIPIENVEQIILENSTVSFNEPLLTSKTISFKNCKFENNNLITGPSHAVITYSFNLGGSSEITYSSHEKITVKNADFKAFCNNKALEVSLYKDSEVIFKIQEAVVTVIDGSVKFLKMKPNTHSFDIGTTKGCKIGEFNSEDNIIFENINLTPKSRFLRRSTNEMYMESLEMSKIEIKNLFLTLDVRNINLADAQIVFIGGNASLDVQNLNSISTTWEPKNIKHNCYKFGEKISECATKSDVMAAQEFFSQMKEFFSRKGNSIVASYFYAVEMDVHRLYLQIIYPWTWRQWWQPWNIHHERVIAETSKISSNFGQNWFQALCIYLFLGLSIGLCFVYVDYFLTKGVVSPVYESYNEKILYLADILSPLTIKFDNVENYLKYLPGSFVIVWIFWKIIAGYLIYQMIISSRKFVRF